MYRRQTIQELSDTTIGCLFPLEHPSMPNACPSHAMCPATRPFQCARCTVSSTGRPEGSVMMTTHHFPWIPAPGTPADGQRGLGGQQDQCNLERCTALKFAPARSRIPNGFKPCRRGGADEKPRPIMLACISQTKTNETGNPLLADAIACGCV